MMPYERQILTLKGFKNRSNTVFRCYTPPRLNVAKRNFPKILVHFLGDCQQMYDSPFYGGIYSRLKDYSIDRVGRLVAERFHGTDVLIVLPRQFVHSRSIYSNFVNMTTEYMSIPHYSITTDCLLHLQELIFDFYKQIYKTIPENDKIEVAISGFSSGGIVLNQMIYSLKAARMENASFRIMLTNWYFLDIGSCLVHGNYLHLKTNIEGIQIEDRDVYVSIVISDFQINYKDNKDYLREKESFEKILREDCKGIKIKSTHLRAWDQNCDYLALHFSAYNELFFG